MGCRSSAKAHFFDFKYCGAWDIISGMEKCKDYKLVTILKHVLPILVVIGLIFYLTTQSPHDTRQLSDGMQIYLLSVFPDSTARWTYDLHWFRTLLHVPLYFLLGIAAGVARPRFWQAAAICGVIALADEVFKIYLPTREFQGIDLVFDAIGFFMGIAVVIIYRKIKRVKQ